MVYPEAIIVFIDPDLHANPTRYNESDNARLPPTDDKSDAEQAPTPKQATAKDHDNLLFYFSHNIGFSPLLSHYSHDP